MKPKVSAVLLVDRHNNYSISYYYHEGKNKLYLFTGKYSPSVIKYFSRDRALGEILAYNPSKNVAVGNVLAKLPKYVKYVKSELQAEMKSEEYCIA